MKTIRPTAPGVFPKLKDGVHSVALGNMTQWHVVLTSHNGDLYVGVVGGGCYVFSEPPASQYVVEKMMRVGDGGDATNLADFIACQLGHPPKDPQGDYYPNLMESVVEHEA